MIQLKDEQRVEVLREVALLLDRENRRQQELIRKLQAELAAATGQAESPALQLEIEALRELLARREQALFGDSSEKRPSLGPEPTAARAPQRGHGPRTQGQLPIGDVIHRLAPESRGCPACGGQLEEMKGQHEMAEEITVIERRFLITRHLRQKYRCRCNSAVVTSPGPRKLIPGGRYSPAFAVEIAASKYLDHLPLERQSRILEREGLFVDSHTLWDQIEALARHLEPTYQALGHRARAAPLLHADETHWRLMAKSERKRYWAWCVSSQNTVFYRLLDSRSQEAAATLLGDYTGIVVADGYGAYSALADRAGPSFTLAHCWAHARRKFVEIENYYPQPAQEILELIGELYAVEKRVPPAQPGESAAETQGRLALRARLRQEHSRPITEKIHAWASTQRALPRSGLGQAIRYLLGLWPGLTRFLENPLIPLDNNAVERALRGLVVGRKNHYGSRSKRGCEVAALFYSLLESAKLCGVEPKNYLLRATTAALQEPGTVTLP